MLSPKTCKCKIYVDNIKKELSRIQSELCTTNPNLKFSNDQIEAISTTLPVDKADLEKFFPKSWADRYGDVVLDVVKKEFKDHVGDMESMRNAAREKKHSNSMRWTTFDDDDDENGHPNLFARKDRSFPLKQQKFSGHEDCTSGSSKNVGNNPLFNDYNGENGNNLKPAAAYLEHQNPFWSPTGSPLPK